MQEITVIMDQTTVEEITFFQRIQIPILPMGIIHHRTTIIIHTEITLLMGITPHTEIILPMGITLHTRIKIIFHMEIILPMGIALPMATVALGVTELKNSMNTIYPLKWKI